MIEVNHEQIRSYRLQAHHLERYYARQDLLEIAGACGLQNTPPEAWEAAVHNRIREFTGEELENLLYADKSLLQAWSFRGAPVVFPAAESAVFLSALIPEGDEPWIYTAGVSLALEFLGMSFGELFEKLKQVIPYLDDHTIKSKTALDGVLAELIAPLLSQDKKELWDKPSMYGSPDKQTVGGAVVSFMLRPCAFSGLVVFGKREGISPTFTSYKNWLGVSLQGDGDATKKLARKFLHCFGPTTAVALQNWLGCSVTQAQRIWISVEEEIEPVNVQGKARSMLIADRDRLISPDRISRELILLAGHDPYLDQRDRELLLSNKTLQRMVWKTTTNPGVILRRGEVIGIWTGKKQKGKTEMQMTLWTSLTGQEKGQVQDLAEELVLFQGSALSQLRFTEQERYDVR